MISQILVNALVSGSSYALFALSFGLIYSTARFFHFAHGAAYATGAYLVYGARAQAGLNGVSAIFVGITGASVLGGLMELGVFKPMRRSGATSSVLLLSSLGLLVALQNGLSLIFGDDTKVLRQGPVAETIKVFGASVTANQLSIIACGIIVMLSLGLVLKYSRAGRMVRAVANDRELARLSGIQSDKVMLLVFLVGSGLAGVAGIIVGYDTDINPLMGFNALLMGVVAAIIGGIGSTIGAFLGGLLLGLVQHVAALWLSTRWQYAIVFGVLIVFLLCRPRGFFGKSLRKGSL